MINEPESAELLISVLAAPAADVLAAVPVSDVAAVAESVDVAVSEAPEVEDEDSATGTCDNVDEAGIIVLEVISL